MHFKTSIDEEYIIKIICKVHSCAFSAEPCTFNKTIYNSNIQVIQLFYVLTTYSTLKLFGVTRS